MMTDINTRAALSSRAMLVTLSITQWGAQRLDRKASDSVISAAHAKSGAGRFTKTLIDPKRLRSLQSVVAAARAEHATYTLPWLQDGARILPADAFDVYSAKMRAHREAFDKELDQFIADYPTAVAEAQNHLGSLFHDSEYPQPSAVRERFSWSTEIFPLPDRRDFRVDLADSQVAAIRSQIQDTVERAAEAGMRDAWKRLHEAVSRMVERLKAYKPATKTDKAQGVFRDSLVENLRELVEVLPLLNVTGDAGLASVVDDVRRELCGVDAETLRTSDAQRARVAESAESIMSAMGAFMGD